MSARMLVTCEDLAAAGVKGKCCRLCHTQYDDGVGKMAPKAPHVRKGRFLTLPEFRIIALCCCGFANIEITREQWGKAAWLARKNHRGPPPPDFLSKVDPVFLEIYGP